MDSLSMQLAEIIQNSIEAKSSIIKIEFEINDRQDLIRFKVEDNGKGMDEAFLKDVLNPFISSRTTRKVGLGLAFLKQEVDQCNGKLKIESTLNQGTTIEAWFQKNNIDLPPIGNLAMTIMCFMTEADRIDFIFNYIVNDQSFIFKTTEIKEILGNDIKINSNGVIVWIKEYLIEKMEGIENEKSR